MNIKLYYIHGISRIDTPYFATQNSSATLSKQEEYFNSKLVTTVETSFYPPHYNNVIKFTTEDLDFNTNVNYLSLDFNEKTYYYFIDSIEYVSESIVRVYVTMDVIQTYMFDIYIQNGIVTRKFIDRWIEDSGIYYINRQYLRENVSENEYVYYDKNIYNSAKKEWLMFVVSTDILDSEYTNIKINYDKSPGLDLTFTSNPFYVIPFNSIDCNGYVCLPVSNQNIGITQNKETVTIGSDYTLAIYLQKPSVINAFICPFNCLSGLTIDTNLIQLDDTLLITGKEENIGSLQNVPVYSIIPSIGYGWVPGTAASLPIKVKAECNIGYKHTNYTFNFVNNLLLSTNFNPLFIPQLLDENYIRYRFGSLSNYTSISLYYLELPSLVCNYTFIPSNGNRVYWITRNSSEKDKYNTVVVDNNPITLDIKSVAWNEYVANNRGRWGAAIMSITTGVFTETPSILSSMQNMGRASDIANNPKSYDARYKDKLVMKKKPAREYTSNISSGSVGLAQSFANLSMGTLGNVGGQLIKEYNVKCQPATPKSLGDTSSIIDQNALIFSYEERVIDFDQCAQYYHRNGFLVNDYVNSVNDIFAYVQNRYYFNILKMDLPEVHLNNVVEDEETVDSIKERLMEGLRLWNILNSDTIGDFQYDNLEYTFIGGN